MTEKQKILACRERLDRTLASPGLSNEDSIKSLVKNQLLRSPFPGTEGDLMNVVENRSKEVSNFIGMLRSASSCDNLSTKASRASHGDWKIKQDTEQLRVMYREGPRGSPFHTLLAEGYADGPIDVCLCVSWETTLYKKWWPQYNIPPFKIIMSTFLKRVRIGEEISLLRMKVPWPMSDREALLHYFELEYLEDDLLIVLMKTIPDGEPIDPSNHGFEKDGIPEANDSVRVDLVGGFVLQKISPTRCYFRCTANMDIKLDFMPPSLINFISRQLIGNGHKLYQKALSVAASNEDYREVLKRQLYARARGQGDPVFSKPLTMPEEPIHEKSTLAEEEAEKSPAVAEAAGEVEEAAQELRLEVESTAGGKSARAAAAQRFRSRISPEVESALSMMNEVIGVFRGLESQQVGPSLPVLAELQTSAMVEKSPDPEEGDGKRRFSDEKPAESQLFAELSHGKSDDGGERKPKSSPPSLSGGESLAAGGLGGPAAAPVGEAPGGGSRVNDAAAGRGKDEEEMAPSEKGKRRRFCLLSCFN